MMWDVFNLFGKGKKSTTFKPPRAPGETIRPDDAQYLRDWVTGRAFVEGFVEPETMVNEMSVVLVDDLDESEATETVAFSLDGQGYEIDLNDKNAAALREALAGYVGHARKVSNTRARKARTTTASGPSARELRDWARSNGFEVSDRGRVPAEVRDAFEAAQ